jgi:plasmid maintenance system antidote protein VapI
MKTTLEYIDEAKKALGIESDYGMAKWMGITTGAMAHYRGGKRTIDDYTASKLADAIGLDPLEVIAAANAEREKDEKKKDYWRKIFARCAAACVVFFLLTPDAYSSTRNNFGFTEIFIMRSWIDVSPWSCPTGPRPHPGNNTGDNARPFACAPRSLNTEPTPCPEKKSDFAQFRGKFFLSIPKAAELFGVTERTIRNWDHDGAPTIAMKLVAVYRRDLSGYHPDWKGFTIGVNGKLYGPNKVQLSAEHIRHWRACVRCTSWDTEGCALVKPKPDKE